MHGHQHDNWLAYVVWFSLIAATIAATLGSKVDQRFTLMLNLNAKLEK